MNNFLISITLFFLSIVIQFFCNKWKKFFQACSVVSLFFTLTSIYSAFTGCNLFESIPQKLGIAETQIQHEDYKSDTNLNKKIENSAPTIIPTESSQSNISINNKNNTTNLVTQQKSMPVFLNIADNMKRDKDTEIIHISWTPLSGVNKYKILFESDDPFGSSPKEQEFITSNSSLDIDVSDYTYNTIIFASIAIFNETSSTWEYSDPISFTLY